MYRCVKAIAAMVMFGVCSPVLSANERDPQALLALGFKYEHGFGVERDVNTAIAHYADACKRDARHGCANAAYFFEHGIGVAQDTSKAARYIQRISHEGIDDAEELERQRRIVYKGRSDAETDVEMRVPVIEYLARHVGSAASSDRAVMERIGFSRLDTLRLARLWAERDGDPTMLFHVGSFYNLGYAGAETEDKDREALKWWRRAAEAGDAASQNLLGLAHAQGRWGAELDPQAAVTWFGRAAAQDDEDALVNLGEIYYLGELVPVDYAKALSLFEKAADADSTRAMRFLSWMHYNGQAVQTDCQRALEYRQTVRRSRPADDDSAGFLARCRDDHAKRARADERPPVLQLRHKTTFFGGNAGSLACEPQFVASTDRLGEVANLRVTIELANDAGQTTVQSLAFSPFGMNTMNEDLDGREGDSFSSSALMPMKTEAFCRFDADFEIKRATAKVNGRNVDLLADGKIKRKEVDASDAND